MKRKINPIQAIKANARNLLALCCLGLLVSASLLLPEALIRWQNGRILGVFQPQPQQQAQLSNSRLSFQEKLSLLEAFSITASKLIFQTRCPIGEIWITTISRLNPIIE